MSTSAPLAPRLNARQPATSPLQRGKRSPLGKPRAAASLHSWLKAAVPKATMTAPGTFLFTVLLIIPLVMAIYYSFTNWSSYGSAARFVGLENYRRVFTDGGTLRALAVTGVLALVCTVLVNVVALTLAVLMNRPGRIFAVYRAAVFYPFV